MNKLDQYLNLPHLIFEIWYNFKENFAHPEEFAQIFSNPQIKKDVITMLTTSTLPYDIKEDYLNDEYLYVPKLNEELMSHLTTQIIDKVNHMDNINSHLEDISFFQTIPNQIAQIVDICSDYNQNFPLFDNQELTLVTPFTATSPSNDTEFINTNGTPPIDNDFNFFFNKNFQLYTIGFVSLFSLFSSGYCFYKKFISKKSTNIQNHQDIELANLVNYHSRDEKTFSAEHQNKIESLRNNHE